MTAKMDNFITNFDKKIERPDETYGKEVSSSTQKKESNLSNNEEWKQRIDVARLDINEAYSLFEKFLEKIDDKDRIIYLEKFIEHKITGQVLVAASKNEVYKQELKMVLNLPFGIKVYFDQMITFIKQRESKLNGRKENTNEEIAKPSQQTYEVSSKKRKLHSSETYSESHVGTVARHDKNTKTEYGNSLLSSTTGLLAKHENNSKAKYGNITTERTGSGPGNVIGANLQTADKADIETKDIHVIDHRSSSNIYWK